jgi:hypothetical protein
MFSVGWDGVLEGLFVVVFTVGFKLFSQNAYKRGHFFFEEQGWVDSNRKQFVRDGEQRERELRQIREISKAGILLRGNQR